jgi:hypothetical protein
VNQENTEDCEAACLGEFLNEIATDLKHIRMALEQGNETSAAILQSIEAIEKK